MIIDKDGLDEAYNTIVQDALSQVCTVLIFVSPEADSLCGLKVLTHLLQADSIQYTVKPVSGYEDIAKANEELIKSSEQLRSIIMLNCGGIVNLQQFLTLTDDMCVYVIDSHRPYHLDNVRQSNEQIRILQTTEEGEEVDYPEDLSEQEEGEESDAKTSDEEDENAEKRVRSTASQETRARRREHKAMIEDYYRSSYYGRAVAGVLFDLACQLNKDSNELLWFSIVGLTDLYVHQRIIKERYDMQVQYTNEEVARLNAQDEEAESKEVKLQEDQLVTHTKIGHIHFKMELRFMCFRHWNLFDAMQHSVYIATRLGTWSESGQRQLQQFLAKMGLPLNECQASFSYMKESLKQTLYDSVEKCGRVYKLYEIRYGSFARQHSRKIQICAADMVYSLTALLEDTCQDEDSPDNGWEKNFWEAYDSLSSRKVGLLKKGILLAIDTQKAIMRQATSMIKKKSFVSGGPFRYAIIEDSVDQDFFTHTLALSKLALFMVEAFKEQLYSHRREPNKPFVICAALPLRKTYLVVGVTGGGKNSRNSFGMAFHQATERCSARVKHDGFETSVIEVQKEDLKKFLDVLHSGLVVV
eukprot:gb/GEZN01004489.1/.p1 GENE.gb/GEZN01004489.1/~~gb/GEZN01004489.1/.p1  ORF type:complete len:584 (-),score=68.31 gb/GEZN01004489.1/:81-1832(-)